MAITAVRADPLRCPSLVSIASVAFNNNTTPRPRVIVACFCSSQAFLARERARGSSFSPRLVSLVRCSAIIRAISNARDSPDESRGIPSHHRARYWPCFCSRDAPVSASHCRLRASMSLKRTPPDCISRPAASGPETASPIHASRIELM